MRWGLQVAPLGNECFPLNCTGPYQRGCQGRARSLKPEIDEAARVSSSQCQRPQKEKTVGLQTGLIKTSNAMLMLWSLFTIPVDGIQCRIPPLYFCPITHCFFFLSFIVIVHQNNICLLSKGGDFLSESICSIYFYSICINLLKKPNSLRKTFWILATSKSHSYCRSV